MADTFKNRPITFGFDGFDQLEKPDSQGRYALHTLCGTDCTLGQVERVCQMNRGARRYKDKFGKLPLHYAVEQGSEANVEVIEYLLMHYMEAASALVKFQRTPLHLALKHGCCFEIIEMLLHAYPEACARRTSNTKQLPFHYCILYHAPYDICQIVYEGYPGALGRTDYSGRAPAHIAVRNHSKINILRYLIRRMPESIKLEDKFGNTPFSLACEHNAFLPVVRYLYEAWPFCIHSGDFEGFTPLHKACQTGNCHIVSFLLHVGANIAHLTHTGERPWDCIKEPRVGIPGARQLNEDIVKTTQILSGQRKVWQAKNHFYFPPHFRASVETIIMVMKRVSDKAQAIFHDNFIPWKKVVKYIPRHWFDTEEILEFQNQLQPHLFVDKYKLQVMELDKRRREKVAADAEDIFARRYRLSKVRKELRKFSIDFNKLAVTKALRKVTMTLMGGRDTSDMEAILSQIAGEKEAKDAILRKAKDGLRARKLALKQKLINRGMRILDEEDEPLDAMEKNAKTHDWYEFLSEGYGVDEMFYDQLLRDDNTMFKDLKDKLQEIPSWKAEETDTRNALMQANELLTTEATSLAEEMKDLLHFEDKAHEDWLEEMAFVKQLQGEEKTRTDVQLRRRREQQWKSMQRKPKLPKTPNTGRSAMSSEDGWSYATDDIMSIGSSMAEGLSSEELKFFQRLEFELKQVNADIEYEMGINDAGNEFWTDDEIDYGEVSIPKHKK